MVTAAAPAAVRRVPAAESWGSFDDGIADAVEAEGFAVESAPDEPNADGQFSVEFSRVDQAARIDEIVIPLFRKVAELGGIYDGWGCSVSP